VEPYSGGAVVNGVDASNHYHRDVIPIDRTNRFDLVQLLHGSEMARPHQSVTVGMFAHGTKRTCREIKYK
jgi:hypothetical protein